MPTVSVLPESIDIFQKSAGVPRRTPSIASPTPRSSTQRPQFTQSSLRLLFAASASSAAIQIARQRVVFVRDVAAVHGVRVRRLPREREHHGAFVGEHVDVVAGLERGRR